MKFVKGEQGQTNAIFFVQENLQATKMTQSFVFLIKGRTSGLGWGLGELVKENSIFLHFL